MTEKQLLNISDFSLFSMQKLQRSKKSHAALKIEILSRPPTLFENLVGGSTTPAERGGGVHTLFQYYPLTLIACKK